LSIILFGSKITDYTIVIDEKVFGVSVTRAMHYKGEKHFTVENATILLKKKTGRHILVIKECIETVSVEKTNIAYFLSIK